MLTVETTTRLAELFWRVIDGERQVEIVRQVLAEQPDFSPYAAFRTMDRLQKGYLTSTDLVDFLRDNGVDAAEREGYLLLRSCDSNGDGRLSYSDFAYAALPDSLRHRELVMSRARFESEEMQPDVLCAVVRVFERELQYLRDIERAKELVISRPDFNLLDCFRAVDQIDENQITRDSVRRFLQHHGFGTSIDDVDAFMRRVDRDHDETVSYLEFVDCVLPAEPFYHGTASVNSSSTLNYSQSLRASSLLRSSYEMRSARESSRLDNRPINRDDFLTPLKSSLRGSIRQESDELTRSTMSPNSFSSPLRSSPDRKTPYMAPNLLRNSQESVSFSPLRSSPLRYDLSRSSPLRSSPIRSSPLRSSRDTQRMSSHEALYESDRIASTPLRASKNKASQASRSPLKASKSHHSPLRATTPMRMAELSSTPTRTPKRHNKSQRTPKRTPSKSPAVSKKSRNKPSARFSKSYGFHELIKSFASQVSLDKNLDTVRQELALRADFTLADTYRMFDPTNKGFVTAHDMADTLEYLDLHPSTEDLYTWFRRFDLDSDGRLHFEDFCAMFTPRQCEYFKLLKHRPTKNVASSRRRSVLSQETQGLLRKALALHLEVEVAADAVRRRLIDQPRFDPRIAFSDLDIDGNGYITLDDLRGALQEVGKYATERELNGLMSRYDRDQDGRVSYADFIQEVLQRCT